MVPGCTDVLPCGPGVHLQPVHSQEHHWGHRGCGGCGGHWWHRRVWEAEAEQDQGHHQLVVKEECWPGWPLPRTEPAHLAAAAAAAGSLWPSTWPLLACRHVVWLWTCSCAAVAWIRVCVCACDVLRVFFQCVFEVVCDTWLWAAALLVDAAQPHVALQVCACGTPQRV